jgi:transcriptional regulator with XRE-family HTH domain
MAKNEMADDAVLASIGPRLRAIRQDRGATLTQLAEATGISVSTLSRLESGQRRPTLELLLPLARAHRIALDEMVGAPATGDPRTRLQPIRRGGRTFIPLTRRPGGMQAFKMIIPPGEREGPLKSHEGYEWIYVLAGRLRLRLGELDLLLRPGEVAEFDTHTPHAFSNAGPRPAEVLTLFGPQGERMHVRAQPRRRAPITAPGSPAGAGRASPRAGRVGRGG